MSAGNLATVSDGERVTTDKLMADVKVLISDMDQLLKATASQTGEQIAQARVRAEDSLRAAKARVIDLQSTALVKFAAAERATDDFVRANAWQAMGVSVLTGLVIGILLARSRIDSTGRTLPLD